MAEIAWPSKENRNLIGKRISRLDGPEKVTGTAKYCSDLNPPNLLYARILFSPIGNGEIKSINTKAAESMEGVEAVHIIMEEGKRISWVGQEVVAVAAKTEEIAAEAITKIKVVYETGKAQMDDADPKKAEGRERTRTEGEPDSAFADADAVVEGHYGCRTITHCCLESHGQVTEFRDGELYVWPSTQNVSGYAGQVAKTADLETGKIHVDCQYMGGGFGSKFGADKWGNVGVALSKETGKPVKLMLERDQELMIGGNRPSAFADVKIAGKKDEGLTGWESKVWGSGGMGGFRSPPLPYVFKIPNRKTASQGIPVNRGGARAWRAPGHPQGCLITMAAIEDLAAKLGVDPLEFFIQNLKLCSEDLQKVYEDELRIAADMIGYKSKAHPRGDKTPGSIKRGLGMSIHTWGGAGHGSNCAITINNDGSVVANIGSQDLGTGTRTVIPMVIAETLGLPLEKVKVNIGKNEYPSDGASGGSTTIGGVSSSSRRAATAALNELLDKVAKETGVDADQLEATNGRIQEIGNASKSMSWKEACALLGQGSITQQGQHKGGNTDLTSSGVGGCQMADVSVDVETGIVTINEMVAVQDCGLIIDMKTAESQVLGALIMGVTYALYEETIYDPATGRMLNADMEFYRLAGLADVGNLKVKMMTGKGYDERGVIGLGEPPVISPGAAISNAVANAIGVRVGTIPLTPDNVLNALAEGGVNA